MDGQQLTAPALHAAALHGSSEDTAASNVRADAGALTPASSGLPLRTNYRFFDSPSPRRVGAPVWCLLVVFKMTPTQRVFRRLKARHDVTTTQRLDRILALRIRLAKLSVKTRWYRACIEHQTFPAKVLDRVRQPSVDAALHVLEHDLSDFQQQKENCETELLFLAFVLSALGVYSFCMFSKYCARVVKKVRLDMLVKLQNSIASPVDHFSGVFHTTENVTNLSDYALSETELFALSFGLKFCVPPRRVNSTTTRAEFESLYSQLEGLTQRGRLGGALLRNRLANLAHEFCKTSFSRYASPLNGVHLVALQGIARNKNLVITASDKGGGVVVLNRTDYIAKLLETLADSTKFVVDSVQSSAASESLAHLKSVLVAAAKDDIVTDNLLTALVPKGCTIPRLYGLPKTHKANVPMRPILSMTGSATHRTAKFLAKVLKPVEQFFCQHCIKDSFALVDSLTQFNREGNCGDYVLASVDVVSLFTNVPVNKCLDVISDCINQNVSINFDRGLLLRLLTLCVSDVQFLFNGTFYRQVDGVAMGSPLGPILANIFVGYIESCTPDLNCDAVLYYSRFVDDGLAIAKSQRTIERLVAGLNSVHQGITFTIEHEDQDRKLAFLDVLISRTADGLRFGWTHKASWKATFLHFNSFVPFCWKEALLRGFKHRLLKICSAENLHAALDELSERFRHRGYPAQFVRENFIEYAPVVAGKKKALVPRKPVFIHLPFVGEERSRIWSYRLQRYVETAFPAAKVVIRWDTTRAICPSVKDQLPKEDVPGVVYQFRCLCSQGYVGRTELRLGDRIAQHIPQWLNSGKNARPRSSKAPDSSIAKHIMGCNLRPCKPREQFKILHRGHGFTLNRILEALEIKQRMPQLCAQKDRLYTLKIPWH